ncbi:ABC transporter permease [Streptomyces niveiscabiei]|uniref:ABC transporter permease n=1 Tax=Streptomyces niveiscabiei TaxID=164115 RepID=UPI0029B16A9A|nr:ABC transporter permease [Streptomyces niveiscabiei]MDX3385346.1 ABC transporter permease [Streptomyces niveiscabiei]
MSTTERDNAAPEMPLTITGPAAGIRALARVEARRLLKHPALLGSLALCLGLWIYTTVVSGSTDYPVLHDEDRYLQSQLLVPAAGTFLAMHLAVLRPSREDTDAWFQALVLQPWQRAVAHLLAVIPAVVLTALLGGARMLWLSLLPGAVGSPSPSELATGPALVLLAGTLAVLTGMITRSVAAGPIVLGLVGIATVVAGLAPFSGWRWWGPVALEDSSRSSLPSGLLYRPAVWHLLYLLLLAAAVAVVAVLRSGLRTRVVQVAFALALVGAVAAGAIQLRPTPDSVTAAREHALKSPADEQRCVHQGQLTYCAYPEFVDRHQQWSKVVEGVLRWAPERVRAEKYTVRQHVGPFTESTGLSRIQIPVDSWAEDDRRAGTPGAVVVGTDWGNGSDSGDDATIGLATAFAERLVEGSAPEGSGTRQGGPVGGVESMVCGSRSVVMLWLAGQATQETGTALRSQLDRSFGGLVHFGKLTMIRTRRADAETALRLLDQPTNQVGNKVNRHWDELTDPDTTSAQAAQLLGVRAPAAPTADEGEAPLCVRD